MIIDIDLLSEYGAITTIYNPKNNIFEVGDIPKYYYQIISGEVKLSSIDEGGRETIISFLKDGDSICENMLFLNKQYPVNATVISKAIIIRLSKINFFKMLDLNQIVFSNICTHIAENMYYNIVKTNNNASPSAIVRIKRMLKFFRNFYSKDRTLYSFIFPLTRQQLAASTGLRIETVIRAVKKLEKENLIKIIKRKIHF